MRRETNHAKEVALLQQIFEVVWPQSNRAYISHLSASQYVGKSRKTMSRHLIIYSYPHFA